MVKKHLKIIIHAVIASSIGGIAALVFNYLTNGEIEPILRAIGMAILAVGLMILTLYLLDKHEEKQLDKEYEKYK